MPLVALSPSTTARFKLRYSDGQNNHALVMRTSSNVAHAACQTLDLFLAAHNAVVAQLTIIGLEYAPAGSDIFNPVVWDQATTYGTGTLAELERPYTWSYTGRSPGGHKSRVFLFGNNLHSDASWRTDDNGTNFVTAALEALNNNSAHFLAIDGGVPIWHAYANQGANDHWIKRARG
jgi:hypothetical protein